ncbi:hypothetical protein BD560DRAFT_94167 [Blakeslea trispora]|nr:hypothetical protein BD560DRAFT_94167 [Blakeslea trispora]
MMHVYAIDDVKADDKFLCRSNSDVSKMFESRIGEKLGVSPKKYVHRLVMATGAKTRAHLLGLPSPSTPVSSVSVHVPVSLPASSACEAMSVEVDNIAVPTEIAHSYKQKKLMLVKSIRQVVHSMLEQVGCRRFQAVPWVDLLSGESDCLQLKSWPRFKGDVSKTGHYRLQNLSVRHLNDIKDRLDAGVIVVNAEQRLFLSFSGFTKRTLLSRNS